MKDNGLLKYYKDHANKHGYLKLSFDDPSYDVQADKVQRYLIGKDSYYIKTTEKPEIDGEVLLSQIYSKVGLESAVYTPCLGAKKLNAVVSNDVETEGTVLAENHILKTENGIKLFKDCDVFFPMNFGFESEVIKRLFTKHGAEEYLKMSIFDVASSNIDRSTSNMFFKLNDENKIDGIVAIDNGMSGIVTKILGASQEGLFFSNLVGFNGLKDRYECLKQFKESQTVAEYVDTNEIAEQMGDMDVKGVADEIFETTGFKVSKQYVEDISQLYENMAEDLVK